MAPLPGGRYKVTLSFDADFEGAAERFAIALRQVWNDEPGITNQGVKFLKQRKVWEDRPYPEPRTDAR